MGAFMDHDEEGVVCKSAEQVGCADDDPPGAAFYEPGHNALEKNEAEDSEKRIAILPDELPHFGMLL